MLFAASELQHRDGNGYGGAQSPTELNARRTSAGFAGRSRRHANGQKDNARVQLRCVSARSTAGDRREAAACDALAPGTLRLPLCLAALKHALGEVVGHDLAIVTFTRPEARAALACSS
jgi:hypothetical protein